METKNDQNPATQTQNSKNVSAHHSQKAWAEIEAFEALEDNCWGLRCLKETTGETGCSDVSWIVIGHFMEAPTERQVGSGDTPLEAIHNAIHLVKP